jgi:hypothetical protein
MSFDGTKESCPNLDKESGNLDMSYDKFNSLKATEPIDPEFGKENFNRTCFNICATVDENGNMKGPTYIEDEECKECKITDLVNDPNNPEEGKKADLVNKGLYKMCNFVFDEDSGSELEDGVPIWFKRQQDANLQKNIFMPLEKREGDDTLYDIDNTDDSELPESSSSNFKSIISGLQYDTAFEDCINGKLDTEGDDNYEIQSRISKYTSVKEFTKADINYIKRKLRKIIHMNSKQVQECAELLNLGKTMCQTGVADKTLMIGSLIFSIVGNNKINIMETDNEEKYKINMLIDQLGPLIPQAVKNIIKISKEYETRVCNVPSNTTLLLERIYDQTYDKATNISLDISPYVDFSSLINMDDNVKFIKTIVVLVVFAFLFMHGTNLVIALLSRGSVKSD